MNSGFCKLDCVLPCMLRFRFTLLHLRSRSAFSSSAFRTALWSAIWLESLCRTRCSRASKALNTCELVVILDGGRHGNASGLVNPWVGASRERLPKPKRGMLTLTRTRPGTPGAASANGPSTLSCPKAPSGHGEHLSVALRAYSLERSAAELWTVCVCVLAFAFQLRCGLLAFAF